MANLGTSLEVLEKEPEAISDRAPVRERPGLLHLIEQSTMQLAARQIAIPLEQIADGGEQAAVAIDILKRHVLAPLRPAPLIGNRTVRHDAAKIVTPLCRGHFERREE